MVTDNPDLQEAFPKPPMASLRQGPNLRRQLCKKSHKSYEQDHCWMEEVQYHHRQTLSVLICTILLLICTLFRDYFLA